MKDKGSNTDGDSKSSVEAAFQHELMRLSKKELIERITKFKRTDAEVKNLKMTDYLTHELYVHQIELEMQNRELREAQSDLEITRDRYADLYDFAPVSYITFGEKGIIENINLTGSSMLGVDRQSIIGKPFVLWLDINYVTNFYEHLKKTTKTDEKITDEFKLKINSGDFIYIRMESVRSLVENKSSYLCQSIIIDITESKRREEEAHLRARQLKIITDSLPLQIAYLNTDEEHLFVNKKYIDWFDVSYVDVIGKVASEFWNKKYYARVKEHLNIAFMGQQITFDMQLSETDSEIKYVSVTMIPDLDINNLVCGVIIIFGDITKKMAVEVLDRQRLLDAAHFSRLNTMGEMASEIAHELNQPLAAISIYSNACKKIIKSQPLNDDLITNTLNDITEQTERAGQIIQHIKSLVSKKELMPVYTNVNDLIKSAMALLAVELRSHNVPLSLNLVVDMPLVFIDKVLIEQVIINLSRNAIEAMNKVSSSKRLLEIESKIINANEFQVSIKDTGIGIDKNRLDALFQPFNSTKVDGMGLGLVICKSIIDAHHGRIWVDSTYNNGTLFCFKLPLMAEGLQNDR